jgi:hypothetical protein
LFEPPFCPYSECPSGQEGFPFAWRNRGRFFRKCDGRYIKRFSCNVCDRRFSSQTFKTDYRWRKPKLHFRVFDLLISKVTLRQIARIQKVRRPTVERRLKRLGQVCREFHFVALAQTKSRGGISGIFQMDELETYEHNRRLSPVTMPVVVERSSYFVVHGEPATMAARGRLSLRHAKRKEQLEAFRGKRKSGSKEAVRNTLHQLVGVHSSESRIRLETDRKTTYAKEFKRIAGPQFYSHSTTSSRTRRNKDNLLFPINHTFAMMRDGISRLVRRTWAASKMRGKLDLHFWVWVAYRNYIRGITVMTKTTPAQALGVQGSAWDKTDLLRWKWPELAFTLGQSKGPVSTS